MRTAMPVLVAGVTASLVLAACGETAAPPIRSSNLLPGILSLLGFSGSSLLALNLHLHRLRLPLTSWEWPA